MESANCKLRNLLTLAEFAYLFGIQNNYLYLLDAESATKSFGRQILPYRYLYADFNEILSLESTYILEHVITLVSGIQEHIDTK